MQSYVFAGFLRFSAQSTRLVIASQHLLLVRMQITMCHYRACAWLSYAAVALAPTLIMRKH